MQVSGLMYTMSVCPNSGSSGRGWMASTGQADTHEASAQHGCVTRYVMTKMPLWGPYGPLIWPEHLGSDEERQGRNRPFRVGHQYLLALQTQAPFVYLQRVVVSARPDLLRLVAGFKDHEV